MPTEAVILRLFRRYASKQPDLEVGDAVRCPGEKGCGFIDNITGDFATVTRGQGLREILPLSLLRRARACGHRYDKRGRDA